MSRKAYGSPRSVTSNAHGFRIAVHRITGEIRILYSVHAADPGVVINPQQVRGQIEGGVAQAIGFALTENFRVDENGVMVNPNLRNYRIPTYADIPRTEVLLVETHDSVGTDEVEGYRRVERQSGGTCPRQRTARRNGRSGTGSYRSPRAHLPPFERAQSHSRNLIGRTWTRQGPPTPQRRSSSASACVPAAREAFEAWQREMNRDAAKYPGFHRRGDQPTDRGATRVGGHLSLRLDRTRSGVDQQRDTSEATRRRSAVLRRARHPAGRRRRRAAERLPGHRRGHASSPVGEHGRVPGLAGSTSFGGEQVSRLPRYRAVSSCRGHPGGVDRAVPLQDRRGSQQVDGIGGATRQLLAEGEKFADYHLRTIDNSFGNWFAFDEHGARRRPPPTSRPPSPCGSASIPPS